MRSRSNNNNGIVLVTTMLTVVLVIMLVSAVVYSNLGSMSLTSNFYDKEAAFMAAQSGVQYATTRLQRNLNWNGNSKSLDMPKILGSQLRVQEKNGNVTGIITDIHGRVSVFRIKFNYEDGDGGLDNLKDTTPASARIESPFVSVNNLTCSTPTPVYRALENGTLKLKPKKAAYSVPKSTCCLIVEGFSGRAVRKASLANPIDPNYTAIRQVVEVYLSIDPDSFATDSAACAAGDIVCNTKNLQVDTEVAGSPSNIRSLGDTKVKKFNECKVDGTMYYGNNIQFTQMRTKTIVKRLWFVKWKKKVTEETDVTGEMKNKQSTKESNDPDKFPVLEWSKIPKATPEDNKLAAGTYVWVNNGGKPALMHYAGCYDEGTKLPATGGEVVSSVPGMVVDPEHLTIMFDRNTYIAGNGTTNNLIIRSDINEYGTKPIVGFVKEKNSDKGSTILTADGDITIRGVALGSGSLTSKGSVTMQGPSILESDPGVGVSIYAQKDVNIQPITNTTKYVEEQNPTKHENGQGPLNNSSGTQSDGSDSYEDITLGGSFGEALDTELSGLLTQIDNMTTLSSRCKDDCKKLVTAAIKLAAIHTSEGTAVDLSELHADIHEAYKEHYEEGEPNSELQTVLGANGSSDSSSLIQVAESRGMAVGSSHKGQVQSSIEAGEQKAAKESVMANIDLSDLSGYDVTKYINPALQSQNYEEYKKQQLADLVARYNGVNYSDQEISGVIYAWNDINVNIGDKSKLHLTGAMVAYGRDPSTGKAIKTKSKKGTITYTADTVDINFDPNYLNQLSGNAFCYKLNTTMFATY